MADQGSSQDSIRRFPAPRLSAARAVTRAHEPRSNQSFMPLPAPTGQYPFRLALEEVLPQPAMEAIRAAGRIVFHCVGDTGGVKDPAPQMAVADAMERDFGTSSEPSFFYLLGDVVYHYGAEEEYHAQFYEPYRHYPAPVFAFPGNHDGDVDPAKPDVGSLEAFTAHFCAPVPKLTVAAGPVDRAAMTQPNVYFTLNAPFITLIGLYSNVPEGGLIAADQLRWLVEEVRAAPAENALVVGLHHPLYSVDSVHGSNVSLAALVNGAFEEAGRYPDAVLAAHVHNYQRFTRVVDGGREMPYVVAGNGGNHQLYKVGDDSAGGTVTLPWRTPLEDHVTLVAYDDQGFGYMRMSAAPGELSAEYVSVPKPGSGGTPVVRDRWRLDTRAHRVGPISG